MVKRNEPPLIYRDWYRTFHNIKQRCNNPNATSYRYYGGKGIKCLLDHNDMELLWNRDNAKYLTQASLDRIDAKGHYELANCRFIEMQDNRRRNKGIKHNERTN